MVSAPRQLPREAIKGDAEERLGVGPAIATRNFFAFIGFFVAVFCTVISLTTFSGGFAGYAWFVIPVGIAAGFTIAVVGWKWPRKARIE